VELAQLEAFLQVARHRSFSRAAEALFLTQPSVTARIQSLERELGERLFDRSGRTVTLTDAGNAFMNHAQRAITAVQEGTDAIDAVRLGEVGSLRIGSSSSLGSYVLPQLLRNFRSRRPRVHIHLTTGNSEEVIERLTSGELHVAICRLTRFAELEAIHLFHDDLAMVVPPSHTFASKKSVKMTEVEQEPFLLFERNSGYHSLINGVFLRMGVVPESAMELDSIETTKHMIEAGLGVAILPLSSVEREVGAGYLATVPITDLEQPAQREVGVHMLRNRAYTKPLKDFLSLVFETYEADSSSVADKLRENGS